MWWTLLTLACTPGDDSSDAPGVEVTPEPTDSGTAPGTSGSTDLFRFEAGRVPANVLVVSLDTTRRDRVGRYSGLPTTPFLDDLLGRSVVLDDHRSCSNWTGPSMLCATSGTLPVDLGYWPASNDPSVPGVPDDLETVASLLGAAGHRTHLVTSNPVFSPDLAGLGFEDITYRNWQDAPEVRDAALEVAADLVAGDSPWLLHLHFFDPHQPYCPPEAYRMGEDALPSIAPHDLCADLEGALDALAGDAERDALMQHVRLLYDAELRHFDDVFAETWAGLDALGALDDTLVVFFTDHGEQWLERGVLDHSFHLYAEESRAVAALWAADLEPVVWTGPTLHTDLAATLYALYGLQPRRAPSGLVVGNAPADRVRRLMNYISLESGLYLGVVRGDRQLTWHWSGDYRTLHHDDADPAQLVDRYSPTDPDVISLWVDLQDLVDEVSAAWTHLPDPSDPGP